MKNEFRQIVKEFVEESVREIDLENITQFGSSTYSDDPKDIELILVSKEKVFPAESFSKLFELIKKYERKYTNLSVDISNGAGFKEPKEFNLTIVALQLSDFYLDSLIWPFFIKSVSADPHRKVLFGKDIFDLKFKLTNKELMNCLMIDLHSYVKYPIEDVPEERVKHKIRFIFKSALRYMLINKSITEKNQLLPEFKINFPHINLPENYQEIMDDINFSKEDFTPVLHFATDCLNELDKEKGE